MHLKAICIHFWLEPLLGGSLPSEMLLGSILLCPSLQSSVVIRIHSLVFFPSAYLQRREVKFPRGCWWDKKPDPNHLATVLSYVLTEKLLLSVLPHVLGTHTRMGRKAAW